MTESKECRCGGELDNMNFILNFKIYFVAVVTGIQMVGLLGWAIYAMFTGNTTMKTKAGKKADREWQAEKEW